MAKSIYITVISLLMLNAVCALTGTVYGNGHFHYLPFIQLNLLYILFGTIMQWKNVSRILEKKTVHPNYLIFPVLILFVLISIPTPIWDLLLNRSHMISLFILPLANPETHSLLGIFSGFLFIKSVDINFKK